MNNPACPLDFNGSSLEVGDVVVYVDRQHALANGVVIEIIENSVYRTYSLLNINKPSKYLETASWSTIMYNGSDYRGMTGEYILSLHGVELD